MFLGLVKVTPSGHTSGLDLAHNTVSHCWSVNYCWYLLFEIAEESVEEGKFRLHTSMSVLETENTTVRLLHFMEEYLDNRWIKSAFQQVIHWLV